MKKNWLFRLGITVLVLTCFTACLASGTFAKYTTSASASGTVNVAKWDVKFNQNSAEVTSSTKVNLASTKTANANVAVNNIAPGDKGSFSIVITHTNTQVAFDYSVTIGALSNTNIPVKFYTDAAFSTEYVAGTAQTGSVTATDTADKTVTLYWRWDPSSVDTADTTIGAGAATEGTDDATFTINLSATQKTTT